MTNNGPRPGHWRRNADRAASSGNHVPIAKCSHRLDETDPGTATTARSLSRIRANLSSGQSANFTVTVQLQNTTAGAYLTNTATVSPTAWDNNPQNNSVTLTVANEQEGQTFNKALLFHFTDPNPNATANDFTASVNWGDNSSNAYSNTSNDGSGTVSVVADANGGFDVLGTHDYAEEGNYAIAVTVTGLDGTTFSSGRVVAPSSPSHLRNTLLSPSNSSSSWPMLR